MFNPIQRLDQEESLLSLIATCIRLRHPHRERMAEVTVRHAQALSDDRLAGLTDRLTVWIDAAEAARDLAAEGALSAPAVGD